MVRGNKELPSDCVSWKWLATGWNRLLVVMDGIGGIANDYGLIGSDSN